jgi:hypothetical protein
VGRLGRSRLPASACGTQPWPGPFQSVHGLCLGLLFPTLWELGFLQRIMQLNDRATCERRCAMISTQVDGVLLDFALRFPALAARARHRIPKEELRWVLEALLDEQAPLDRLGDVLEALMRKPVHPLAAARLALGPDLVRPYLVDEGLTLHVIAVSVVVEAQLARGYYRVFLSELEGEMKRLADIPIQIVLLCSDQVRHAVRRRLRPLYPNLPVIAWNEIQFDLPGVGVNAIGLIKTPEDIRNFYRLADRYRKWKQRAPRNGQI